MQGSFRGSSALSFKEKLAMKTSTLVRLAVLACLTAALIFGAATDSLKPGKAPLKSAGPLAFGPDAVQFIGDSQGAQIVAIDTNDRTPGTARPFEIKGLNTKIAAVLGTAADQILVNDAIVNPISKNIYVSVSRGRGPDAAPVILRVDSAGKISEVPLDNAKFAAVGIANAAEGRNRQQAITDLRYVDGKVIVAGLSNEEFSSNLRAIPFPFQQAAQGAKIEIYHGSHGMFETNSPIRTFMPFTIKGEAYVLAAYTCTPLVKIPVSELKAGAKVKGTTIAELGAGNRPLDMIAYKKGGKDYILMANSSRGVMKLSADGLEKYTPITAPSDIAGVPYTTVKEWTGVQQLDKIDDNTAMVLAMAGNSLDLRAVALP
jgi:hypothetical protein